MRLIIFTLLSIITSYFAFSQPIVRLDNSRITASELDNKIKQLMNNASVAGMVISIFNDNTPVYHKAFGYKNLDSKAPVKDFVTCNLLLKSSQANR